MVLGLVVGWLFWASFFLFCRVGLMNFVGFPSSLFSFFCQKVKNTVFTIFSFLCAPSPKFTPTKHSVKQKKNPNLYISHFSRLILFSFLTSKPHFLSLSLLVSRFIYSDYSSTQSHTPTHNSSYSSLELGNPVSMVSQPSQEMGA